MVMVIVMRYWHARDTAVLAVVAGLCLCLQASPAPAPAPSFIENDSIVFPEDNSTDTASGTMTTTSSVEDKLRECIEDGFKIPVQGECRALLSPANVCPEGSWLVLDVQAASQSTPQLRPHCSLRKCPSQLHYWPPLRRCVHQNESASLCPPNNVVRTDYFGDGFCDCQGKQVQSRDKLGACHTVYSRGPCGTGRVWLGGEQCGQDRCSTTAARFPAKLVVPWPDGRCYGVDEQGPCVAGHVVRVNAWTLRPECGDPLTALHLVNPPCSGFDHQGNCKQPVSTPQNYFYSQIASQAKNKKSRKATPK